MRNYALIIMLVWSYNQVSAQDIAPFDIMITELMIDPNPVVGLPNFEWIELYNRSDRSINLEDFDYSSGSTRYALPAYDLAPGAYVMVCDDSDFAELSPFGPTIELRTFPSLTNGGDVARIEDPDGNLIHEVTYARSWYGDTSKDDGGYTLELINPNDPCLASSNWMASLSATGATPAAENSVWNPSDPEEGVRVVSVSPLSASSLAVSFDRLSSMNISEMFFSIASGPSIIDIEVDSDDPRTLILTLAEDLELGNVYTLMVDGMIQDCIGGSSGDTQAIDFVIPEPFGEGDLIINEVLFNPIGSESDYVELYNISSKFIDISQLMIGNLDADGTGSDRSLQATQIIAPRDYLVITEDKAALLIRYPSAIAEKVIETDLPSFNNTDGNVTIFTEEAGERTIIDAFDYNEDMHNDLIDDPEGVALERVKLDDPSSERSNWKSGAASKGYGSPTLSNTQAELTANEAIEPVFIRNKTFFPEKQMNENLEIVFSLNGSDYIGSIDILDSSGRHIHQLANNQLIGRNDLYLWDGRDQTGVLENAGVYIVVVRLFTSTGDIIMKKLPCVLSRQI